MGGRYVLLFSLILAFLAYSKAFVPPYLQKRQKSFLVLESDLSSLPLPPCRRPGPFRKIRDFVSYLKSPEKFVETRAKELGPVFMTNLFLKPAVVVGGQKAVQEFIQSKELKNAVVHSALPDTFSTLHTEWGALNLDATGVLHQQARTLFAEVLGKKALEHYVDTIEVELDHYIDSIERRIQDNPDESILLTPELSELCLQIFAQLFSGQRLSPEQVQAFVDYNSGLLAVSKMSPDYRKGEQALKLLRQEMTERHRQLAEQDGPGKFFFDKFNRVDGFDNIDRRAVVSLLFIWGAYAESAALMANSLILLRQKSEAIERIRAEANKHSDNKIELAQWSDLSYTLGTVRETLRLVPQVGGGFRYSDEDFELCGYRIPAGTTVTLDPRIGNKDPALYPEPETFEPERWVAINKNEPSRCPFRGSALGRGPAAWFPGGTGAHGCPGVPLAELIAQMFVSKMVLRFDSWEYSGTGLMEDGQVKFKEIPSKVPSDEFGMIFRLPNGNLALS